MTTPKVIFPMSDYGHDPTETSIPYQAFKEAGFEVFFATENGTIPACDEKMLSGITQKLLGAKSHVVQTYKAMTTSPEWQAPLSWTAPTFSLAPYTLVFLAGGHDRGVRQLLDSDAMRTQLAAYFPQTRRPSIRFVAAVCHGVVALAAARGPDGKSVIHACETTALPGRFEQLAFWGTRVVLGDYYKTYGAGSEDVEESVKKLLDDPKQYKNSLGLRPFVIEDKSYNYISARFPGDAKLLGETIVKRIKEATNSGI